MLFTIYFFNWTTGEVVCKQVYAVSATAAEANFRRRMRDTGTLYRGCSYSLLMYDGLHDLSEFPAGYREAPRKLAR